MESGKKITGIRYVRLKGTLDYDGPLGEDLYHSDPVDYLRSMKRLHDIPARVVHAGHFGSFDGNRHRALIRAWLDLRDS